MNILPALNRFTAAVRARLDNLQAAKNTIGVEGRQGTVYRNIFNGFVTTLRTPTAVVSDDFTAPAAMVDDTNVYIHYRLPYNFNIDSKMFWIKVVGYSFGSNAIVETTAVGYSYAASKQLLNTQLISIQTAELYTDAAGNIILCILMPSIYYTTVEVDSMVVGNGTPIKRGMLQCKLSKSNRVAF